MGQRPLRRNKMEKASEFVEDTDKNYLIVDGARKLDVLHRTYPVAMLKLTEQRRQELKSNQNKIIFISIF